MKSKLLYITKGLTKDLAVYKSNRRQKRNVLLEKFYL